MNGIKCTEFNEQWTKEVCSPPCHWSSLKIAFTCGKKAPCSMGSSCWPATCSTGPTCSPFLQSSALVNTVPIYAVVLGNGWFYPCPSRRSCLWPPTAFSVSCIHHRVFSIISQLLQNICLMHPKAQSVPHPYALQSGTHPSLQLLNTPYHYPSSTSQQCTVYCKPLLTTCITDSLLLLRMCENWGHNQGGSALQAPWWLQLDLTIGKNIWRIYSKGSDSSRYNNCNALFCIVSSCKHFI